MDGTPRGHTRYEVQAGVAWLRIDRPEARNALDHDVRQGLWEGLRRFDHDDGARVLVLTGEGDRAFSAGADLKELAAGGVGVPPDDFLPQLGRNLFLDKPTIAAVNGVAYGAGFMLAMMCDLCFAAEEATFCIPEARVGRGVPWVAPLLRTRPPRVLLELMLTAEPIGARRAYELGLLNGVTAAVDLESSVQQVAERMAQNSPLALAAAKQTFEDALRLDVDELWQRANTTWEPVYTHSQHDTVRRARELD